MRTAMKFRAAVFASLLTLVSCAGSSEVSGDRRVVGGIGVTFSVRPAQVEVGQAVRLTLRLTNNTGRSETLTSPTSQKYDFWITIDDREVWRWSEDKVFTQALTDEEIAPHASVAYAEPWTGSAPGTYIAHGVVLAEGFGRELRGELKVGE